MTTFLAALTIALITFTAWRYWMVARFFRRARTNPPPPGAPPRLVSILQPILSGDPTLPQTLAHNLAARSTYAREFLWLVDEDDAAGQAICTALIAAYPSVTVHLLLQPAPPQGVNPKTFKLVNGLAAARGDVVCVLDDDTMLPNGGLEQCLPYLNHPGAGLAFGLPYQVNFSNAWSSLIALFVNANSLPTYVPYASLHEPVTINGMFYALRRRVLDQMGGFSGLERILADDFAVAQRVRSHGLHLVQTPLRHAISTQVPSLRRYLSLMQRWFIFPRESLLRHLPCREQALVYALALAPTLMPLLLLLLGVLLWPSPLLAALLALYFAVSYAGFLHLDRAYLGHPTPAGWSLLAPVLQVVFPLQLLTALLLPQRITWRGHIMQIERGGGFRFVKRR
jgi:ceramide glucosyltransferase